MIAGFRELVSESLSSEGQLSAALGGLDAKGWQNVAELFAARLPEFDALYSCPGAEELAAQVARTRGVPHLSGPDWPAPEGEVVVLTVQLQDGLPELEAVLQARAAGWRVPLVVTAVERTDQGARARLTAEGVQVRAAVQVAATPRGLVFERRSPERWLGQE